MEDAKFQALVAEALDSLPEPIAVHLDNVAVLVEDLPDGELLDEMGIDDDMELLGLYQGESLLARSLDFPCVYPDQILLYKLPILNHSMETGESVTRTIRDTIIHEIGHHFGFSEEELVEMGLE